jgi:hypothetical protein
MHGLDRQGGEVGGGTARDHGSIDRAGVGVVRDAGIVDVDRDALERHRGAPTRLAYAEHQRRVEFADRVAQDL